jgi:conjugal transfer pilin signal peptidase TrbI
LDFNITDSLPDQVFLTLKHWSGPIQKGDYVAFEWHGGGPFPKGIHFVKLIAGVPGDVVTMDAERNFWLNGAGGVVPGSGELLGWAKPRSRTGEALDPGPVGVIPPGYYYVRAPHPDSLDSRYALTGWIHESEIIGKSYGFTLFHK